MRAAAPVTNGADSLVPQKNAVTVVRRAIDGDEVRLDPTVDGRAARAVGLDGPRRLSLTAPTVTMPGFALSAGAGRVPAAPGS
jgi:hypothetical protein